MTPFTLSQNTQNLIALALQGGANPGTNNINYYNAYNAIYNDLLAQNAAGNLIDSGVLYWFSQAGSVNAPQVNQTAASLFIRDLHFWCGSCRRRNDHRSRIAGRIE
jgi:hypothetical protein